MIVPKEAFEMSITGLQDCLKEHIDCIDQKIQDASKSGYFSISYQPDKVIDCLKIKRFYEFLGFDVSLVSNAGYCLDISWNRSA